MAESTAIQTAYPMTPSMILADLYHGKVVGYEPGDGTHYKLILVHEDLSDITGSSRRQFYLCCLNLEWIVKLRELPWQLLQREVPVNAHRGIKPLLVEMGFVG
jgi:hypothetical protein